MLFYTTALYIWEVIRGLKPAYVFIWFYLQREAQTDCEGSYSNAAFVQQHLFDCGDSVTVQAHTVNVSVTLFQGKTSDSVKLKTSDGLFPVNCPQTQLEKWELVENWGRVSINTHRVPHLAEGI